jgi:hypothetical protein
MKSLSLVGLFFLSAVGLIEGDVAPRFLVPDEKFPAMRFENLTDYPQFDFYLMYAHGSGNPYATGYVSRVESGVAFRQFKGKGRIGGAKLLAVSKGASPPDVFEDRGWFHEPPSGCLCSEPLEGSHFGEGYLVSYRVKLDKEKLEVTMQTAEIQPFEATIQWMKSLSCFAVPLAFVGAVAWIGLRMVRRLFARKADASASQASNTR